MATADGACLPRKANNNNNNNNNKTFAPYTKLKGAHIHYCDSKQVYKNAIKN
jgi:hypothetical protein